MINYHHTLSRRDFMKRLGLTGMGLGGASMMMPQFHDLDEISKVTSSKTTSIPWWVKTIDQPRLFEFTSTYTRYENSKRQYNISAEENAQYSNTAKQNAIDKWKKGDISWSRAAQALTLAANSTQATLYGLNSAFPLSNHSNALFESLGMSTWSGSPEEANHLVKNAAFLFGADLVAVSVVDERCYYKEYGGKLINFVDSSQYSDSAQARNIPKDYTIAIWLGGRWPLPMYSMTPSPFGAASVRAAIGGQLPLAKARLSEFIRYLGYDVIADAPALDVPVGLLGGAGELGRHNRIVSPMNGPNFYTTTLITNFNIQPDSPISAGITEFCKSCALCATACPGEALETGAEPSQTVKGPWNNPGHSAWYEDSAKCYRYRGTIGTGSDCTLCFRNCPFTNQGVASSHEMVKIAISTTSLFNGFFANMDKAFGFGNQGDAQKVWNEDWGA